MVLDTKILILSFSLFLLFEVKILDLNCLVS